MVGIWYDMVWYSVLWYNSSPGNPSMRQQRQQQHHYHQPTYNIASPSLTLHTKREREEVNLAAKRRSYTIVDTLQHQSCTLLGLDRGRVRMALLLLGDAVPTVAANVIRIRQHVQDVLLLVRGALVDPEEDAAHEGEDGDDGVVPHEVGVLGDGHEGLAEGVGKGGHEVPVGGHDGAHVLGRLGEGVLEPGDGGEDLGEADEDVGDRLDPHVEGRLDVAVVHVLAAGGGGVDLVLDDGGGDHGQGGEHEADGHALDRREADALLAQPGV